MTLDGVMEAPEMWVFQFWNDELAKYAHDQLFASDALLMGRGSMRSSRPPGHPGLPSLPTG
jgi:hypothetical protein